MSQTFFTRLRDYYKHVGLALKDKSVAAKVFPNKPDNGYAKESIYYQFLQEHIPEKCQIVYGGFLFDVENGLESKQIDIIITNDTCPRFNITSNQPCKSFAPVDGTLGVVSIKSKLNKMELYDSLYNIASIPATPLLHSKRVVPTFNVVSYADWPFKIIFSYEGIKPGKIIEYLDSFYLENPSVPLTRRPNIIHVAGEYLIWRHTKELIPRESEKYSEGKFEELTVDVDVHGIGAVVTSLQSMATSCQMITFDYSSMLNKIP